MPSSAAASPVVRPGIGTLNEKPLHAALKAWYYEPGDRLEARAGRFVVDLLRGDGALEIQTGSFSHAARKLRALVEERKVCLIHPVAREHWIVKRRPRGRRGPEWTRRKSPKREDLLAVFEELVSIPELLAHPNFSLLVSLTQEEVVRRPDRRRRRGYRVQERRLLSVVGEHRFDGPEDLAALLPAALPDSFDTAELARALGCNRHRARQMAYCARRCRAVDVVGKRGNALLYARP